MDELREWIKTHTQLRLALSLGITQAAVSQWLENGEIPLKRVRAVERATGIPAAKLHPDMSNGS